MKQILMSMWFAVRSLGAFDGPRLRALFGALLFAVGCGTVGVPDAAAATVSAGRDFSCAVFYGGAYCWGDNADGQVGAGVSQTNGNYFAMQPVWGLDLGVTAIASGGHTSCAIRDGALLCWGLNFDGQLGVGRAPADLLKSYTPLPVPGLSSGVTDVSVGENYVCAIQLGKIFCWGDNLRGRFGNGNSMNSTLPVRGGFDPADGDGTPDALWQRVSVGGEHACGLYGPAGATQMFCWGGNLYSQLGFGDPAGFTRPEPAGPVSAAGLVTDISAGARTTCAIRGGVTWCWGGGDYYITGQSRNGPSTLVPRPEMVSQVPAGLGPAVQLSVGSGAGRYCVTNSPPLVNCWGSNVYGGYGNLRTNYRLDAQGNDIWNDSMFLIFGNGFPGTARTGVAAGPDHSCAWGVVLDSNEPQLFCAGLNNRGQLGDASTVDSGGFLVRVVGAVSAPFMTSPAIVNGTVGTPLSLQLTSNQPASFSVADLPPGLVLDPSGLIHGAPTTLRNSIATVSIANANGTRMAILSFNIDAPPPAIISATTAAGTVGSGFGFQLTANQVVTWGATGLPPGLGLNTANGVISGFPTTAGTFVVNVTAGNGRAVASATLTISIATLLPVITSAPTASGTVGVPFNFRLVANQPANFSVSALPPGLVVNIATGVISGTPAVAGIFPVTLTASNANGATTGTLTITIVSNVPPPVITSPVSAGGTRGVPFRFQLSANQAVTFSASGLPPGLSLNMATGLISGVPAASGNFTVTLTATNAAGARASATLRVGIGEPLPPVIISPAAIDEQLGFAFSFLVTADQPATFSASGLPPGLTLNTATGLISGIPAAVGTFVVLLRATNANGSSDATLTISITQEGPPPPDNNL